MNNRDPLLIQTFADQATAAAAKTYAVSSVEEALGQIVHACVNKPACRLLSSGCETHLPGRAADLCELKNPARIMAAPGLGRRELDTLISLCQKNAIKLIGDGLRLHAGGIDIGITRAEHGIAETGTVVIGSGSEDVRLAGMISEIHAVLLPASGIVPDTAALAETLRSGFAGSSRNYTAFITGPSRTADIERALTLGVHGPLELYIFIIPEERSS